MFLISPYCLTEPDNAFISNSLPLPNGFVSDNFSDDTENPPITPPSSNTLEAVICPLSFNINSLSSSLI